MYSTCTCIMGTDMYRSTLRLIQCHACTGTNPLAVISWGEAPSLTDGHLATAIKPDWY